MACIINDNESGPNIVWSSTKCANIIDEVLNDRCILKPPNYTVGNLVKFDDKGNIYDSQLRVDDNDQNPNVLWSSTKTGNVLNTTLSKLVRTADNFIPNKLLVYDANGVLQSSPYQIDDNASPSDTNLYSSQKWDSLLANTTSYTIPKFLNAKDKILCMTKSDGTLDISDNYTIDDSISSSQNLWSSQKVKQYMDANVLGQCQDHITNTNAKISTQNSQIINLQNQFSTKIDKINGISSNLATFDSFGNLQDSGIKFDDNSPPSNKILWTSSKIGKLIDDTNSKSNLCAITPVNFTTGNIPSFTTSGSLQDSGYTLDDTRLGEKILWSSQKQQDTWNRINAELQNQIRNIQNSCNTIQTTKMNKLTNLQPNSLMKSDASGNLVSSGFIVDDSAAPNTNVLWTTNKYNSLNLAQFSSIPIKSKNLIMYDTNNKIVDSGYRIDNNCTTSECLWTAEKINSFLNTPKFFVTGIFAGNLIFDNNMWYKPQFTISDSSSETYTGATAITVPSDGFYFITIYGNVTVTDKCEIQMQFKSGNLSNYADVKGTVNLNFGSADKYNSGEQINFYIKVITPSVQVTTFVQNPMKFYVNKI